MEGLYYKHNIIYDVIILFKVILYEHGPPVSAQLRVNIVMEKYGK